VCGAVDAEGTVGFKLLRDALVMLVMEVLRVSFVGVGELDGPAGLVAENEVREFLFAVVELN
jgi:hypothetical protein